MLLSRTALHESASREYELPICPRLVVQLIELLFMIISAFLITLFRHRPS